MSNKIYYRILGYVVTIALHTGNMVVMMSKPVPKELLEDPRIQNFGHVRYRFLTCWTFFLQIVYAVAALICDILILMNSNKKSYRLPKYLKEFRETLFASIVWPTSVGVCLMFWPLYNYDRSLVYPVYLDRLLSLTNNHIMHTAILPISLWEVLFQPRSQPKSHMRYIGLLISFFVVYLTVLIYTYIERGVWLYPILYKVYGTAYFPLLIAFVSLLGLLCYVLHWVLVYMLWGSTEKTKKIR